MSSVAHDLVKNNSEYVDSIGFVCTFMRRKLIWRKNSLRMDTCCENQYKNKFHVPIGVHHQLRTFAYKGLKKKFITHGHSL